MTLIQVSPLDDDVQPGSATWCALPCCLLADWGCCAVQLPNGAAGVCGGRMALRGVRLPNGAAVCDATVGAPTVASADAMWARGSVQAYDNACELCFLDAEVIACGRGVLYSRTMTTRVKCDS